MLQETTDAYSLDLSIGNRMLTVGLQILVWVCACLPPCELYPLYVLTENTSIYPPPGLHSLHCGPRGTWDLPDVLGGSERGPLPPRAGGHSPEAGGSRRRGAGHRQVHQPPAGQDGGRHPQHRVR